jgi:hypothetical protein
MTTQRKKNLFRDTQKWFEALDKYNSEPFFLDRDQPLTPERVIFEEDDSGKRDHDA